ncbi:biotin/lipoyl-binding protein [bacterium]|nr:biotin/lipoyl-binding protein [bacterium]
MKLLISGFVLASILLIIGSCGFYFYKCKISEPEWVIRRADRGEVRQIVSATGSLAASNTVEVGCQISGIIASICVDFNDRVIAGQQIAMLDPVVFDAQLEQARANLEGARADESNLKSKLAPSLSQESGNFFRDIQEKP